MPNVTKVTKKPSSGSRLLALDYLRGYFIVVIIVDHMWRFPSLGALMSGETKLWVTAAEGFVIISGFMIGYIRGYKGLKLPFTAICKILLSRAAMLYAWMVAASVFYIWLEWTGKVPGMPYTPTAITGVHNWPAALTGIFTMSQPHTWVHFLYLYSIFLALSVPVVWLFRKKLWQLVIVGSITLYIWGLIGNIEWLKWQIIFFLPSVVGFHFEYIRSKWRTLGATKRRRVMLAVMLATVLTVVASVINFYFPTIWPSNIVAALGQIFYIESFTPARAVLAFLWFTAFVFLFQRIVYWLRDHTYGVLEYIGTHSLTAYIAHGLVICLINLVLPFSESIIINTAANIVGVLAVYYFIRLPVIRSFLPR